MSSATRAGSPFAALLEVEGSTKPAAQPLNEFVFKVQTRCNINCAYCYVYNMGDESWRDQPTTLSPAVARQAATRILEHARAHNLPGVLISIHGGEPLLGGIKPVEEFVSTIRQVLGSFPARFSLQTNATLVDKSMGSALAKLGVGIGVSLDGPEAANRRRLDVRGKSTYVAARAGIAELARHPGLLHGVLCVIQLDSDPVEVFEHLRTLGAPSLDFLLPHGNWTDRPPAKDSPQHLGTAAPAPYGEWLIKAFDRWVELNQPVRIRIFDDIVHLLLGGRHSYEGLGLSPAQLVVIEADGSIELVDHLGPNYAEAAVTGLNVFDNSLDEVLAHPGVACRQTGESALAACCRTCNLLSVCGGGLITHRYRDEHGYRNSSVYCSDLYVLISHIKGVLTRRLAAVQTR